MILNGCFFSEHLFRIVLTHILARATNGAMALDTVFVIEPRKRELANRAALKKLSPRSERRYLARRLQILRATGKMLRMQSFSDMKMRDIAAAADLSPANLYNYFKGKHELLFFCQDNSLDRMLAALRTARSAKASAAEKLRLVIESHLRCVLDDVEGSAAHRQTDKPSALPEDPKELELPEGARLRSLQLKSTGSSSAPINRKARSLRRGRSAINCDRNSVRGIHGVRCRTRHSSHPGSFELERAVVQP